MSDTPSPNGISSSEELREKVEKAMQDGWDSGDFDDMIVAAEALIASEVRQARIDELKRIPDSTVSLVQGYYFNERIKQLKKGDE